MSNDRAMEALAEELWRLFDTTISRSRIKAALPAALASAGYRITDQENLLTRFDARRLEDVLAELGLDEHRLSANERHALAQLTKIAEANDES